MKVNQTNIISLFCLLGINLTTEHSEGQLDAYIQSGEWDLEGLTQKYLRILLNNISFYFVL